MTVVATRDIRSAQLSTTDITVVAPDLGPVTISRMTSYDPNGDAQENETEIWALQDNNPKTVWSTDCYVNQFFGTKQYVGVLIELSRATTVMSVVDSCADLISRVATTVTATLSNTTINPRIFVEPGSFLNEDDFAGFGF